MRATILLSSLGIMLLCAILFAQGHHHFGDGCPLVVLGGSAAHVVAFIFLLALRWKVETPRPLAVTIQSAYRREPRKRKHRRPLERIKHLPKNGSGMMGLRNPRFRPWWHANTRMWKKKFPGVLHLRTRVGRSWRI